MSDQGFPVGMLLFQEHLESFWEAQRASQRHETRAAIKRREILSATLAVPEDCLLGRVPTILKVVDDHVLFPSSPFWSGRAWIRVSKLESLHRVCYKFRGLLREKELMVHVMPYLSLLDAYPLHQLVQNPGRIYNPEDDGEEGQFYNPEDDGEEGQYLPAGGRSGVLVLHEPDDEVAAVVQIKFTVLNYGLLWAKATSYLEFIGAMNPAKELNTQLDHYLGELSEDLTIANAAYGVYHLSQLEEASEQAKSDLILCLYNEGIDPHNTILAMDANLHEELYDLGYDPCYPHDRTNDAMKQQTEDTISAYMSILEQERSSDVGNWQLPEARWSVLAHDGEHQAEALRIASMKQISAAVQTCKEQILDAIKKMDIGASRPSVIGVTRDKTKLM